MAPISKAGPPFQSLGSPLFLVLDLSKQFQTIWANLATIIVLDTLVTPSKLGPGGLQFPPWTADCGARAMGCKGQKWPKMTKFQNSRNFPYYGREQKQTTLDPNDLRRPFGPISSIIMVSIPLSDMHIEGYGARRGLKRLWPILGVDRHSYSHSSPLSKLEVMMASILGFSPWPPTILYSSRKITPGRK
ncbi:hypothetical protein O181_033068 [Austropuccinia psidii MF-1]|uniref:Uncharacterized protein n=1 Tax=Austropuccinia psidii MF-1 TaxID=1389203 RepID=A0A9Q3D0R4_9BASI|nr:hypothetical protein [Austropuccinia psidii MF-1]